MSLVSKLVQKPLFLAVTSTCPFCLNALRLAEHHDVEPEVLVLDKTAQGPELRKELAAITRQKTVPYIFSHGTFIGGFTELSKKSHSFWIGLSK